METDKAKAPNIGDIAGIKTVLFQSPINDEHYYYVGETPDDSSLPDENTPIDRAHYIEESGSARFYMLWVADCFEPTIAIVRADNFEEAYEDFTDSFSGKYSPWLYMALDRNDLEDYRRDDSEGNENEENAYTDTLSWNSNGDPYDNESINGREMTGQIIIIR